MSEIDDGGQAFPCAETQYSNSVLGMTLRDYFAGQALTSLLAVAIPASGATKAFGNCPRDAYELADAMLAERKKAQ